MPVSWLEPGGLADLISKIGFPIVVAMYVLIRMERAVNQLTKAIEWQTAMLERLVGNGGKPSG